MLTLDDIDRVLTSGDDAAARPMSPRLQRLVETVQSEYGYRVLVRPHTFGTGAPAVTDTRERVIGVFAPKSMPERDVMRHLFHELGHVEQDNEGIVFPNDVDGWVDREVDADRRGAEIASRWGYGDIAGELAAMRTGDALRKTMWGLRHATGISDPRVLSALRKRLILGSDPFVSNDLRRHLSRDNGGPIDDRTLTEIAYHRPELIIGFDRSILRHVWTVPRRPLNAMPRSLPVRGKTKALERLVEALGPGGPARWWHVGNAWAEATLVDGNTPDAIAGFIRMAQATMMVDGGDPTLALEWDWWVAITNGDTNVYSWIGSLRRGRTEVAASMGVCWVLRNRHTSPMEQALRAFINSTRRVCSITRRPLAHLLTHLAYTIAGPARERFATQDEEDCDG